MRLPRRDQYWSDQLLFSYANSRVSKIEVCPKPTVLESLALIHLELVKYFFGNLELESFENTMVLEKARKLYVSNKYFCGDKG